MEDSQLNLTVLLGAGASCDAGLLNSTKLTEKIVRSFDDDFGRRSGSQHALNAAVGAMVAYDTARGADVYEGIEVERLFSAVQMLAVRHNVELTPFVSSWMPGLEMLSPTSALAGRFGQKLINALNKGDEYQVGSIFSEGVEWLNQRSSNKVFRSLEHSMVNKLLQILQVDPTKVDYLAPLVQGCDRPVQIATLNYDRSIEEICESKQLKVDTGITNWPGGFGWKWEDQSDVRLLKLHGSVDWWDVPQRNQNGLFSESQIQVNSECPEWGKPALIFGQREKLRSEGPFLAMLRAFDEFLEKSDRLLVVGYSFQDSHINSAIKRWMNSNPKRGLSIIDPGGVYGFRSDFFRELLKVISEPGTVESNWQPLIRAPHQVIEKSAKEGISDFYLSLK